MREVKDLHQPFIAYLRKQGIPYIYHRSDRRSGINKGHPDFTLLWCGHAFLIEFKTLGGKLSIDQLERIEELSRAGTRTRLCTSLSEAIGYLESEMGTKRAVEPTESISEPSKKLYRAKAGLVGEVILERNPADGECKFVRMASNSDRETIPSLPAELAWPTSRHGWTSARGLD
jgi:hypothetical protein